MRTLERVSTDAVRLTIDEVIEHCHRTVNRFEMMNQTNNKQYEEHRLVAACLDELKEYRKIGTLEECRNIALMVEQSYNQAVDDFASRLKQENRETLPTHSGHSNRSFDTIVDEIAQKCKGRR